MADAEPAPPGEPAAAAAAADAQPPKVVVMFRATGDAPILKQNKFKARARPSAVGAAASTALAP